MMIPTEPIGSIPRPLPLIEALSTHDHEDPALAPLYEAAVRDTIERFEAAGSPVVTDGEQKKYHNFWTYSVHGLANTAPDGFKIPFAAGHVRRMPRLTSGPFRYRRYADSYLDVALEHAKVPVKQAVIAPSALSLMYPADGLPGYTRGEFIEDLLREHETEIRNLVELHGGTVRARSDGNGRGWTFTVELPLLAMHSAAHEPPRPQAPALGSPAAEFGQTDLSGVRVPAIALTAFARSDDRTRALRAGYLVHVAKPVEPSELVATVATVAGRAGDLV